MLKIKDDFDLKELEKFGYKLIPNKWGSNYYSNKYIFVFTEDRKICFSVMDSLIHKAEDSLFDLIENNLVKKVEE